MQGVKQWPPWQQKEYKPSWTPSETSCTDICDSLPFYNYLNFKKLFELIFCCCLLLLRQCVIKIEMIFDGGSKMTSISSLPPSLGALLMFAIFAPTCNH